MNTHFCNNCRITGPAVPAGTPCRCCKSTKGQTAITQEPGVFLVAR